MTQLIQVSVLQVEFLSLIGTEERSGKPEKHSSSFKNFFSKKSWTHPEPYSPKPHSPFTRTLTPKRRTHTRYSPAFTLIQPQAQSPKSQAHIQTPSSQNLYSKAWYYQEQQHGRKTPKNTCAGSGSGSGRPFFSNGWTTGLWKYSLKRKRGGGAYITTSYILIEVLKCKVVSNCISILQLLLFLY
jgi:hypothetical protein